MSRLMPKKVKIERFIKIGTGAEVPPPQSQSPRAKLSGLYLLALRSRVAESQAPIPKRRLTIHIDPKLDPDGRPVPVRITLT
jgi:hypothetical protein